MSIRPRRRGAEIVLRLIITRRGGVACRPRPAHKATKSEIMSECRSDPCHRPWH
ncbi:hypothetical protein [Streptomyces carpinensis]|uniref:Uncharacterized protein n=1 Tax=Streptomyces carpinensis TaxID=66369 RepID=A0ABV1VZV5_9ACTN|nr:hypothetical protein [Streptomyces carpinensis]